MNPAVTLVWIAPEPPDSDQARALSSWASAHGLKATPPTNTPTQALAVDLQIAERVEALLDSARDAIAARERDGADRALSAADSTLRAHPELPQAAWLMAEVERARASAWRNVSATDTEAAERAWMRAEAIDGGRVAGLGELGAARHPDTAAVSVDLSPSAPQDAELWLDGARTSAQPIATHTGIHTLVVTSGGAPIWARWIETPRGTSSVLADAPGAPPCSIGDVGRARVTSIADDTSTAAKAIATSTAEMVDAKQIRCEAWAAAFAGAAAGSVRVTMCEKDRCGPALSWRTSNPPAWTWSPQVERSSVRSGLPWAAWGLVGVGVAVATGVIIMASGALQPAPSETRFVSGGIKKQ